MGLKAWHDCCMIWLSFHPDAVWANDSGCRGQDRIQDALQTCNETEDQAMPYPEASSHTHMSCWAYTGTDWILNTGGSKVRHVNLL